MKIVKIDKTNWDAGLDNSRESYRLIGPFRDEIREITEFCELSPGQLPDLAATDTVLSPKAIVYPQSEVMFEYSLDAADPECSKLKRPARDYSPAAVVGIRPYDAAAFLMLQKNFDTPEYRDPYWCDAFAACTFVGLAVNHPHPTDFSTSTGCGPFSEKGLDVLLVDMGDHFLGKILTDKGDAFSTAAGWEAVGDADAALAEIDTLKQAAEAAITGRVEFDNIEKAQIMDLYNAEFWEDVAFSCINCGTCTYVCPTCWCFDIQDETHGKCGKRYKNWDTCMGSQFTLHASGHNPRGDKVTRVRQRFMHKLKYYLDRYQDGIMCVGCGRCVKSCPVNIDIREVCRRMNDFAASQNTCAVA